MVFTGETNQATRLSAHINTVRIMRKNVTYDVQQRTLSGTFQNFYNLCE